MDFSCSRLRASLFHARTPNRPRFVFRKSLLFASLVVIQKTSDSERMTAAGFFESSSSKLSTTFLYHQNAKNENPRCVKLDLALRILVFQDFILIWQTQSEAVERRFFKTLTPIIARVVVYKL